jgi:hypothetical protein
MLRSKPKRTASGTAHALREYIQKKDPPPAAKHETTGICITWNENKSMMIFSDKGQRIGNLPTMLSVIM